MGSVSALRTWVPYPHCEHELFRIRISKGSAFRTSLFRNLVSIGSTTATFLLPNFRRFRNRSCRHSRKCLTSVGLLENIIIFIKGHQISCRFTSLPPHLTWIRSPPYLLTFSIKSPPFPPPYLVLFMMRVGRLLGINTTLERIQELNSKLNSPIFSQSPLD